MEDSIVVDDGVAFEILPLPPIKPSLDDLAARDVVALLVAGESDHRGMDSVGLEDVREGVAAKDSPRRADDDGQARNLVHHLSLQDSTALLIEFVGPPGWSLQAAVDLGLSGGPACVVVQDAVDV